MMLGPGTRLGPYEIQSPIGAGGMGEVYRARDSRLNRDVAIKVLPAVSSSDPERLARFEQEARAAAALNHPNILAVYDIGTHAAAPYIVSELLDGETLRERLARGPLPTRKAVEYALQIAHGLTAAHAKAIVHRDLKPENIFITTDGHVKILDFGLAKLTQDEPMAAGLSVLPTTPPRTMVGVVLGTIGYMAPEQVRGVTADHRADIFAFGAVLYEMLSGRRAFAGETPMDTMTAILKEEPADLRAAAHDIPPGLDRIVDRCLEKNPASRFQTASDLAFALESLSTQSGSSPALAPRADSRRHRWLVWSAVAALTVVAAAAGVVAWQSMRSRQAESPEMRLQIITPPNTAPLELAISPDGRTVVFPAFVGGKPMLWRRPLDSDVATPIAGTEYARDPFWSPDGRSLGFFADQKLKRIDLATSAVQALADAPGGYGAAWSRDGVIIAPLSQATPLYRIPASGGKPVQVTRLQPMQAGHRFPAFLPDGRHFVFFGNGAPSARGIFIGSLDSPDVRRLVESDSRAEFWPPDYLIFARQEALVAQHLDLRTFELIGEPVIVAPRVAQNPGGDFAQVAVSASAAGPLAYRAPPGVSRQLRWLDRSGKDAGSIGEADDAQLANPRVSPDGSSVAARRSVGGNDDIWVMDTAHGTWRRLTFEDTPENRPVWSPDGTRLAFESYRKGVYDLYLRALSGGTDEVLLESAENKNVYDWSPDGRFLLYTVQSATTATDLWALPIDGRKPFMLVNSEFNELGGRFSPDSRWIAYLSNETGRYEIYVRPFPGPGRSWQVSANGARQTPPQWRSDGREIYYVSVDGSLMSVPIILQTAPVGVKADTPSSLFRVPPTTGVGALIASPEGNRFLVDTPAGEPPVPSITILLNWHGGR